MRREGERERDLDWLPLACPQLGSWARHDALTGNQTSHLSVPRPASTQPTEPHQPGELLQYYWLYSLCCTLCPRGYSVTTNLYCLTTSPFSPILPTSLPSGNLPNVLFIYERQRGFLQNFKRTEKNWAEAERKSQQWPQEFKTFLLKSYGRCGTCHSTSRGRWSWP